MTTSIDINSSEDHVFEFETFEITYAVDKCFYILSEEGYFVFDSINDFVLNEDSYQLKYEDDIFTCSKEDFEKIKQIYFKVTAV